MTIFAYLMDFKEIERIQYFTSQKVKKTGYIFELSRYEKQIMIGPRRRHSNDDEDDKDDSKIETEKLPPEEIRKKNMRRAEIKITDYINSNAYQWHDRNENPIMPIFLTLTFWDNVTDLDFAHNEFKNFIRRLSYEIRGRKETFLKYVSVVEFQDRGAIHYHVVFFNLPFMDRIYDKFRILWTCGSSNIKAIKNTKNIGRYMCKYLTKANNWDKLQGRKSYFVSDGLKTPIVTNIEEVINVIRKMLPEESRTFENSFRSEFLGEIKKEYYNLKEYPEIEKNIQAEIVNKYLL
jgi:hypothetical protein